jgi:restriction system protein
MAEVTRKRLGELMRGAFAVLVVAEDPVPAAEVIKRTAERVPPTQFEEEGLPKHPKIRRFDNLIRFTTLPAVKAGWLVKGKDGWTLTDEGRIAYTTFTDPEALRREAERLYRAWKEAQPAPEVEQDVPEEEAAATVEEAEETAWADIRDYLGKMPPYDFQALVAALLRAMGYHVLWVAPPGPDRGIDVIAHTDPLGTSSPRIKVQVKRQLDTKIGRDGISSFVGTLGAQDVGIYVSAGGFTPDAEREARSQEQRRVTLIDLDRLVNLWIEHSARLEDADRQRLPLKPIYFLAPRE